CKRYGRCFLDNVVPQRGIVVLGPANDRQNVAAVSGGRAVGLEHLHAVLSSDSAGRLCLRAFHIDPVEFPPTNCGSFVASDSKRVDASTRNFRSTPPISFARGEPAALAVELSAAAGRSAVFRGRQHRAASSEMVFPHRTWNAEGPLFPLQREQSRQFAGPAELPGIARTASAVAPAMRVVGGGLWHPGFGDFDLRGMGVASLPKSR